MCTKVLNPFLLTLSCKLLVWILGLNSKVAEHCVFLKAIADRTSQLVERIQTELFPIRPGRK